jgi:RNA polymerase sigma-70 factor (ECF subfamily)
MFYDHKGANLHDEMVMLLPALRTFSRGFHRDPDNADDLVQETLQKALGALHSFRPGTSLKNWMFTIMRNSFNTSYRRRRREPTGIKADVAGTVVGLPPNQEWSIRGRELEVALHALAPEFRETIMLICVSGISYEEASEICGCPVGTIKSRLNRGKEHLLRSLGDGNHASLLEA